MSNYYQILGVSHFASASDLRKAFREKAKCFHPDVNHSASAAREFKRVNEAYQVLKDSEKRRIYDMRLHNGYPSQKVYYRPGKVKYRARGDRYAHYDTREQMDTRFEIFEKYFDVVLFVTLLFVGFFGLFYGLYRLLINPSEDLNPFPGIIMGVLFTGLILFFWRTKDKYFKG
ncbi:MAG: hypothetical protein EA361_04865 [Bacteroidetes bacterium]|nr:MAG: hypothetical protein EA361_04865 [Bacteroidota bacterium]